MCRPAADVDVDVVLESVLGGVVVSGTVSRRLGGRVPAVPRARDRPARGRASASCARRTPTRSSATPMTADWLDLEPLAHDACILELPLAPLCRPDCLGLCPELRREPQPRDLYLHGEGRPEVGRACPGSVHPEADTRVERVTMAVPKKKTSKSKSRSRRASAWTLHDARAQPLPAVQPGEAAARRLPALRVVQGSPGGRGRLSAVAPTTIGRGAFSLASCRSPSTPWAATAPRSRSSPARDVPPRSSGSRSCSSGPTDGSLGDTGGLEVLPASEVIAMHEDPAQSVRTKKDSTLVRAAEAVRDGRASAMVSAGNTGATMASALLRMGRLPGVARPAIAAPHPGRERPPGDPRRRRRQRRLPARVAGAVRPDGRPPS